MSAAEGEEALQNYLYEFVTWGAFRKVTRHDARLETAFTLKRETILGYYWRQKAPTHVRKVQAARDVWQRQPSLNRFSS